MAYWSPENATNAFLNTLKMERKENEPNAAEFISALAAGNNAQKMVAACTNNNMVATNLLALISAANQSGGQVICIVPGNETLLSTKHALKSEDAKLVNFVIGNATELLLKEYKDADFLLIDCDLEDYEGIVRNVGKLREGEDKMSMVVGYNAFCKGSSWQWSGLRTQLLPIGGGLLVTRIGGKNGRTFNKVESNKLMKKSNWIVKVDKCTGEEHVFRVRSSQRKLGVTV